MDSQNRTAKYFSLIGIAVLLVGILAQTAMAQVVLFQDDVFQDVLSDSLRIGANDGGAVNTGVQFGNDSTASENGVINWNVGTNRFQIDHAVDVTGGLTSDGSVDFSSATQNILRESADPNAAADCSALGEIIINTTTNRLEVCTTTGTPGVWSAPTVTVPTGAANPGTCSVSDLYYNTTVNSLMVCTATNTWSVAGPQDFESVYAKDADQTLTTANGNFSISAGTGTIDLNANGAGGSLTGSWGSGGLDFSSATGSFSITGSGASTVGTDSGNLSLATTTSGDIALNSAGDVTMDDQNLSAPLKLNNSQTALSATYTGAGDTGILDALNGLTLTTAGQGTSLVGVDNTFTNITGSDLQSALSSIDSKIGSSGANVEDLTWYPEYPDTVIFRDGSDNEGTLTADYDNANAEHYYEWTSTQATQQDMGLRFRYPLPADFASTGNFTFRYRTQDANAAHDKVDLTVYDDTDASVCGSSTANVNTSWTTATITPVTLNAGCAGLSAGDIMEIRIQQFANKTGGVEHWAQIGKLMHAYNN